MRPSEILILPEKPNNIVPSEISAKVLPNSTENVGRFDRPVESSSQLIGLHYTTYEPGPRQPTLLEEFFVSKPHNFRTSCEITQYAEHHTHVHAQPLFSKKPGDTKKKKKKKKKKKVLCVD
eukprot:Platyproteum_vivax@DN12473_c0_g1_i1.p1